LTCATERARSLSPPKEPITTSSPSFANSPADSPFSQTMQPPLDLRPSPLPKPSYVEPSLNNDIVGRDLFASELSRPMPAAPRSTSPTRPGQNNATALSRSGTLSWQQRPSSRDSNSSRPRPFSGLPTELAPSKPPEQPEPEKAEELSRKEIARSLGSKDPTWFRQTPDRGAGSAAFRRGQEGSMQETVSTGDRMRLPGMSRESTTEPEKSPPPDPMRYRSASRVQDGSSQSASRPDDYFKPPYSNASVRRSAIPFSNSQTLMPSESNTQDELPARPPEALPPQSKALSDRPPSPTKGLGGFVQSAMMKRSDSVNKRWSTQAAPGLKRGDSVAGQRGTLGNLAAVPLTRGGSPPRESKSSFTLESAPSAYSRPDSSHSTTTGSEKPSIASQHHTSEPGIDSVSCKPDLDAAEVADKLQRGIESRRQVGGDSLGSTNLQEELPTSPKKTMDPKRWSPTKASWLESALSKPESPKITSPRVEQPTWRSELQKPKQSNVDSSEARSAAAGFDVVTQPGSMRLPPTGGHSRPLSIGGLSEGFSSGLVKKAPVVQQKPPSIQGDSFGESPPRNSKSAFEPPNATITPDPDVKPNSSNQETDPGSRASKPDANANADQPLDSTSKQKPPTLKPKPQTPPKMDFRANLKSRQKDAQESTLAEPEFKNVFGKLRRTETKNYVAPDLLKSNILTGKAALNVTGGPQKTKRSDEFKESILLQKEAMKAGGGSINRKAETNKDNPAGSQSPVSAIPEALARRNQLSKASGVAVGPVDTPPSVQASIISKPPIKSPFDLSKKGPTSTGPTILRSSEETSGQLDLSKAATKAVVPSPDREQPTPSIQLADVEAVDKAGSVRLANRMNPALASILMRGPPSNTSSRNQSTEDLSTSFPNSARPNSSSSQNTGDGQLTHVTKGRAKGPKRRLPKTEIESKQADKAKPTVATKSLEVRKVSSQRPQLDSMDGPDSASSTSLNSMPSPLPKRPLATSVNPNETAMPSISHALSKPKFKLAEDSETSNKPKPVVAVKSPDLRAESSPKPQPASLGDAIPVVASDLRRPPTSLATTISSPGKHAIERETMQRPAPITKDPQGDQSRDEPKPNSFLKSPMPPKATMGTTGRLNGLGLELGVSKPIAVNISKPEPTPPQERGFGPRTATIESPKRQATSSTKLEESASTVAAGPAASQLLDNFFGEHPKADDKADIDTHAIVSSNAGTAEKTKTLRMQIWEVNGDGKRQDMPPQQEHIIFEESMYLCVHSLENAKGSKSTEAFLWCGDGVGEAAVEDAQLFCRKIARENGARLELLKQGKETASFIQALGGIIITRRSKSSALYMLCGRRHLGHVSFDEVDIDADKLCSGFPYLISARFGKLYLWKGKGSGADELGCARLIGMDLGLTGEIEEVNEGDEPPTFWEAALGINARVTSPKWSDHWTLRGTPDHYRCRLFRIELENPRLVASFWSRRASSPAKATKSGLVQEITPFCQRDLEASHIFVLDAYFEIFVFVGDQASSKHTEFVTALFFAQEYSILAASLQDRPLVPRCHVALSEAPPDFQTVFRKWTPTPRKSQGGHPITIPLSAAIEALA
jgi:hypothetical protein